jgi:hypothetical protein
MKISFSDSVLMNALLGSVGISWAGSLSISFIENTSSDSVKKSREEKLGEKR